VALIVFGQGRKSFPPHNALVLQHPLQVRQAASVLRSRQHHHASRLHSIQRPSAEVVAEVAVSLSGGALRAAARRFLLEATRS